MYKSNGNSGNRIEWQFLALWIVMGCLFYPVKASAQKKYQDELFVSDEVITLQLSGDIRTLLNDRETDSKYYSIKLSYKEKDNTDIVIPIKVKTRGRFRKTSGNCSYPPLLLNFSNKGSSGSSLFGTQNKIKLVTPCRGERFVVREYLVYKLYNLITPKSFKARLVKVEYADTVRNKNTELLYGILLEEEDQMAERNNTVAIERMLQPQRTLQADFLKMAVFDFMIGNTDWSVQYLQNVKLIASDSLSTPATVPYDFDHAGIVAAPYAHPTPALLMSSTRERRYRGYCLSDMAKYAEVFALFNSLKDQFYSVYTQCPLLDESYIKSTTKFLDEFYKTINDPKAASSAFLYPCVNPDGTANVVIKPLDR
jgi:hypothetical protein